MRLCFIGGGNPLNKELDDVMYYLSNSIEIGNNILIIPFATENSKVDKWFTSLKKSFKDIGMEHIKLLDYQLTNQEMQKEIKLHSILYFTGGRPEKLMRILAEKELIQEIKEFSGLIVGVSAGALVFCEDCIITKDQYYLETQVIEGLGLVDFSVEVHYNGNNDKELFSLSANRDIYAIPNGSAIFWEDNVVKPIHNVTLFRKRKKQIVTED